MKKKGNDIFLAGVRSATVCRREPVFDEKGLSTGSRLLVKTKRITITSLQSNFYWSSTENDNNNAWNVNFNNGNVNNNNKNNNWYGVRAVLAFT
jgi:putative retron-type reverse transcriptase